MRAVVVLLAVVLAGCSAGVVVERNVSVPMRDGVVLRADIYRPSGGGPFPVLVYRTPYGKDNAAQEYHTHLEAVKRNYAVVLQDVRGRYESDGIFDPYRNEGRDGYDTIEWAAKQPWSNGSVGTYGLSYPGAVQWLAAMEQPPHLKAMVPAMTFSSPRNFFYMNGVFDTSWLPWIYSTIAPDARRRLGMPQGAQQPWSAVAQEYRSFLPLRELPHLRREAPYYFEWLAHPPEDPWWDWAELRGRYARTTAAVLNLSGWYDEAYGPEGAVTNFNGLLEARRDESDPRTELIVGPWIHGVASTETGRTGDLDFGPDAAIDYDDVVLDFLDRHLRGVGKRGPAVRYFEMGTNAWRSADQWPLSQRATKTIPLYLSGGKLHFESPEIASRMEFVSDPRDPVSDPHGGDLGPHDYQALRARKDLLTYDTDPLERDIVVSGAIVASISASCDCRDFDLWVRLYDVHPDGRAFSLMSPGNDVMRASYRDPAGGRKPLVPGEAVHLRLPSLLTSHRFAKGHRIRAQLSGSFAPHLSRNLQSGASEADSAAAQTARISVIQAESRLLLPSAR